MLSATSNVFSHGVAAAKEYPFSLRRTLLALAVGLLAIGMLASFNAVFAVGPEEGITGDEYTSAVVTVVAAALVFFMQAGFAFLGAGLIRSKNTQPTTSPSPSWTLPLRPWAFGPLGSRLCSAPLWEFSTTQKAKLLAASE